MIGQTVSHYRILEKIGEGGMGVVYKAEDLVLRRTVALKFLSGQILRLSESRMRFLHEAQAAAMIDHPNVCAVYGFEETGNYVFIVMAFVEGVPLNQHLRAGRMQLRDAIETAIQIGEGLRAAHNKRIVHRDVKPGNVLISNDGAVHLTDFGLALLAERTRITAAGTLVGTAAYMSPEQALTKDLDCRSDIWSLGAVLYEMIAGKPPFQGRDVQSMLLSIIHDSPPGLRRNSGPVPPFLQSVVGKALAKKPEQRYQFVDDFIVDLRAVLRELPPAAQAPAALGPPVPAIDPAMVVTQTQLLQNTEPVAPPSRIRAALHYIYGKLRDRSST